MSRTKARKKVAESAAKSVGKCGNGQPLITYSQLGYGLVFGAAFGLVAGAISGNYVLMLPIGVSLGLVFSSLFRC